MFTHKPCNHCSNSYYALGTSNTTSHTINISAPFDYANDNNGLTVIIDGVTVYSTYGHWCARSWNGTIQ